MCPMQSFSCRDTSASVVAFAVLRRIGSATNPKLVIFSAARLRSSKRRCESANRFVELHQRLIVTGVLRQKHKRLAPSVRMSAETTRPLPDAGGRLLGIAGRDDSSEHNPTNAETRRCSRLYSRNVKTRA